MRGGSAARALLATLVGVLLTAVALPGIADAFPGDPDPNYGGFGQSLWPLQAGADVVQRAELGFDQKLLLVGHRLGAGDEDLLVVRVDSDGTIDEGFGSGGVVQTDVAGRDDVADAVALDPFGFVVVAGWVQTAGDPDVVVLRYNGAGVPDPGFGTGGVVQADVGGADDRAHAIVVRPDQHVLVAGESGGGLLLVQYDDLGVPDSTFGTSGVTTANPTAGTDRAWAAALQSDGKVVVAGEANGDVLVARFLATGVPDPAFGTAGFVVRDAGGIDVATDVTIRGDGAVFAAGSTSAGAGGDGFILALDGSGGPLPGFGSGGLALSAVPGNDGFTAVDVDPGGGLVAAGWMAGASDDDALVVRLDATGALDPAFGVGGVVTWDFATGNDVAVGMAVERSGRIVVGASAGNGADADPAALRLLDDPPAPGVEFQINTYTTDYQYQPQVAVDGAGRFIVVWSSYGGTGTDAADFGIHAQRYEAGGEPSGPAFQVNSYTTAYQWWPAVATDASGNFVVVWQSQASPGSDQSGTSILGRRFAANGTPIGTDFQVNTVTVGDQAYPRVAANASGDFVVVWESESSDGSDTGAGSLSSVQGRFFAAGGAPIGAGDLQLNTVTTSQQRAPVVAMEGSDVVVAWDTETSPGDDTSPPAVVERRFSSAGAPVGPEDQVNTHTAGVQAYPGVAMGSDGRFLVTWHGDGPEDDALTGFGTFARRFAGDGTPVGDQFVVNDQTAGEQVLASAAYDTDDSFIVTWQGAGPGDGFGVFGRRFDAGGVPLGASFLINRDTADAQQHAAVQGAGGRFAVVWETYAMVGADRSGAAVAGARFDGQTTFTTTSTLPGGTTTSTSSTLPGSTTTSLPGGTTTSTTMPSATTTSTTTSTSTTLPGGTTTTSTTLPGGTTTTSTTLPGGTTTTSTTLPGGTTTTSTTSPGSTSTSTTMPGGSTTTTLPTDPGAPLLGTKLIMKTKAGDPKKTLVKAIARDTSVGLGSGNGSTDDPVLQGGSVRVAVAGGIDADLAVSAEHWKYLRKAGQNRGYKAKGAVPVKAIVVKPGKLLKVVVKGGPVGLDLASEPSAVEVVVRIGGRRHCMRFVGSKVFVPGRKLVSKTAERPTACLP